MFLLVLALVVSGGIAFGATKADNVTLGTRTVAEGETISFAATASDPDGDNVTISVETLPVGGALSSTTDDTGTFTASFSWTPNYSQAGVVEVWIVATDEPGAQDWGKVVITVTDTNRAPVLNSI